MKATLAIWGRLLSTVALVSVASGSTLRSSYATTTASNVKQQMALNAMKSVRAFAHIDLARPTPALNTLAQQLSMHESDRPAMHRRIQPKDQIYTPECLAERVFFVVDGAVATYQHNPVKRRLNLTIHVGGETSAPFGMVSLLDDQETFPSYAMPMRGGASWLEVSATALRDYALSDPVMQWQLLRAAADEHRWLDELAESVTLDSMPMRLAKAVLLLAGLQAPVEDGQQFYVTKRELGDGTGSFRETASYYLRQLSRDGVVERGYSRLTIPNVDELRMVAGLSDAGE